MNTILDQIVKNVTQNENGTKMNINQNVKSHCSKMSVKKIIY